MPFASFRILLAAAALLGAPLAGIAAVGCAPPAALADGWRIAPDAAAAGFDPDRLCEAVRAFASSPRNLHGLVIERGGALVAEQYRAGADATSYTLLPHATGFDAQTRHDVRSITKSVLGLLWGIAEGEGAVPPLQAHVLDLFPDLADLRAEGRERITIEDLLAMRSGLDWDETGSYRSWSNDEHGLLWRGDQARYVFDRPMAAPAGTRFNYDGGHAAVLGLLLAKRTGLPLPEYARRKLFTPLGITDWEWASDLRGRPLAYTGLRLRPRDLARIGRMVLADGVWAGRQVVPANWLRASLSPHVASGEYGYFWWRGVVRANGHAYGWQGALGNGGQRLFLVPALNLVVVTTAGQYNDRSIGREVQNLLEQVVGAVQSPGGAEVAVTAAPKPAAAPVFTRAVVQSLFEEEGGRQYVRLQLQPIAQFPFSTLTFRVVDKRLVEGLRPGASVAFRAQRIAGENTLTELRVVAPCAQWDACQQHE